MNFLPIRNLRPIRFVVGNSLVRKISSCTKVQFCDGVKTITMCEQKKRNNLSLAMMQNLLDNINEAKCNDRLRVIVIAAEGPVFSAGHNLKEIMEGKAQQEKVFQMATELMFSIIDSPVPVIAQVDGIAVAAGCQLVAQCDLVVCTENSKFSTPGASVGIFCSTPGIPLARKVQASTALNMLLTGRPITANEALKSGLVTKVCCPDDLEKEVKQISDAIIDKSRSVIELGKRFYYKQRDLDIRKAYVLAAEKMVENLQLPDGKEGVRSFVEKRKPVWTHKNE